MAVDPMSDVPGEDMLNEIERLERDRDRWKAIAEDMAHFLVQLSDDDVIERYVQQIDELLARYKEAKRND